MKSQQKFSNCPIGEFPEIISVASVSKLLKKASDLIQTSKTNFKLFHQKKIITNAIHRIFSQHGHLKFLSRDITVIKNKLTEDTNEQNQCIILVLSSLMSKSEF